MQHNNANATIFFMMEDLKERSDSNGGRKATK
jgi:hypothetical protein